MPATKIVKVAAPGASAAKAARYSETAVITLVAAANPKRAASAKRFALYGGVAGATITVGAYLDACLVLDSENPRYRWRADLAWDLARGYITIA